MSGAVSERFAKEFPTIAESARRRSKPNRVGFLIDPSQKKFDAIAAAESFPCEEIGREVVKIKSIPIFFRWPSNGGLEELRPPAGEEEVKQHHLVIKGPMR